MQIILNGLINGLAIALLAFAFQMVYLPTRVFFIGLAGLYSMAPYLALACLNVGAPIEIGIFAAITSTSVLALIFEWANHAPLTRKNASNGAHLVSSLGLYTIVVQILAIIWGNDSKLLRAGLDYTTKIGDVFLTGSQILMACATIIFLIIGLIFLRIFDIGLRLRALADNPTQFALFGYNVDIHRLTAFVIAGVLAAVSSLVTAYDIGFDPYSGLHKVFLAVVAVIVGGRNSFIGPIFGGLLLGFVRAQVSWYFSAGWQETVTFTIFAFFLLFLPQGLFGRQARIDTAAL